MRTVTVDVGAGEVAVAGERRVGGVVADAARPSARASLPGTQGPPGPGTGPRTSSTFTTGALAAGASESGTVELAKGYRLMRVGTDRPARVRVYTAAQKRDADAGRPIGTDPTGDHGCLLEVVTTAGLPALDLSPVVDGFDGKDEPDGSIPCTVTNLDSTAAAVQVTLLWQGTEA